MLVIVEERCSNSAVDRRRGPACLPRPARGRTALAVKASSGWSWFMDELEAAGAGVVNALQARRRIGWRTKTDKLEGR